MSAAPTRAGERSWSDSQAPLGYGTTRTLERVLSSCGLLHGAAVRFETADDVAKGGVLFALPALLGEGLLRHTRQHYALPPGFYPLETIFLLLGLLALVRCPSLEQTRYEAPGEWGRLLGLDRLPEVKTLRAKIGVLCATEGRAAQWQSQLAQDWMAGTEAEDPALAGLYYADGHVRVYHGGLSELPRRYVSRLRLCLRGTTDYWVNGLGGAPFFVISQTVNPGLVSLLRERIVPRLLAEAPQPSEEALQADPKAVRFTVVVDREGYSPTLFAELAQQRIAILTYHKNPGDPWPAEEFVRQPVRLHTGREITLDLAERPASFRNGLSVREVRLRDADGSQGSILTTHPTLELPGVAAGIKARWSQENFLKYMKHHFGLDRLIEYGVQPLPETTVVINPAFRRLDQQVRRERAVLTRLRAQFAAHGLGQDPTPEQTHAFEIEGGLRRQQVVAQEAVLAECLRQRQQTPRKLPLKELPESQRFGQLCPESKHFIDTIKMIAYRAESALAGEVRECLGRDDDARALLRRLFTTPVHLRPDPVAKTLTVEVHRLGSPLQDAAIAHLCSVLTQTQTTFPSTHLRLIYRQIGSS